MRDKIYFISDAHLGAFPENSVKDREEWLIKTLLSWKEKASHIVILGDLFEFWFEYKHYVNRHHFKLFKTFLELKMSGVEVHYIKGNHDFALEDFFPKELGVQVHKEFVLNAHGKKFLCVHGDGIPPSDRGYRFLRRILDFPLNRFLFKLLHPDWGMNLAAIIGKNSRQWNQEVEIDLDSYLKAGENKIKDLGVDYFIHGHHHIQGVWDIPNGQVVSPGQWLFFLSYAVYDSQNGFQLVKVKPELL